MNEPADVLFADAHLLTMRGDGVGYVADGAVAVRDGLILDVGDSATLRARYRPATVVDASRCVVLPGLIDVHMHTHYAVVRGVAQDVSHWMQRGLAPFSRHMDDGARLAGTRLNVLEAMLAGTTTMGDYLRPYEGWPEVFESAGIRACLTPTINAFPAGGMAGWAVGELYPLDDAAGRRSIDAALAVCDRWHGADDGRITTMLGPQGTDMIGREQLIEIRRLAEERDLSIHMHVAQGDREIDQMVKRYGQRTIAFMESLGYLDERLLAVHLTEASDAEAEQVARSGARLALCSGSIGIIDGIVPPAKVFRDAGGVVGLGSDQASGNNCNNIFNEMKLTALFNKIKYRDPEVMPAWEVLRMGTIEGARAIGLGDRVGSIEVGKQADLIVVDIDRPNLIPFIDAPVRTLVPNLVYAGTGHEVRDVFVAGRQLVANGKALTINEREVRDGAQAAAERIGLAVNADPLRADLALAGPTRAGLL